MSHKDEKASDVELGEQIIDSVFDFLYHDARRVGSFISQIDSSGNLVGLKQTESAEHGAGSKFNANVSGSVAVARGGASMEDQKTALDREILERSYDPYWTNALTLLDMLDERGMIKSDIEGSRIGQFVKVSGVLSVTDLSLWKGLWSLPALKTTLMNAATNEGRSDVFEGNRAQRRKAQGQQVAKSQKHPLETQLEAALALIGMLPHTIQARLATKSGEQIWCSLREDGLVVSAADLTLKHGMRVSGRWTIVGVLDAFPEMDVNGGASPLQSEEGATMPMTGASPLGEFMQAITPAIRGLLGRPFSSYGITPLVIFREVSA